MDAKSSLGMSGLVGPSQTSDILKEDPFLQELFNGQNIEVGVVLK